MTELRLASHPSDGCESFSYWLLRVSPVTAPASSSPATPAPLFQRLIDRPGKTIAFTIDGVPAEARTGDFLATAILLNRPHLRRFEFAPTMRAGFCLMAACQDCWVELADGRRVRSCSTLVEEGMAVLVASARQP